MPIAIRKRLSLLCAGILVAGLAGCGVRGSLEPPPEVKAQPTATAESGQGKPAGAAAKPHKSFILDGLIQ